jgi:WD40-like Beta Propeller Repeat
VVQVGSDLVIVTTSGEAVLTLCGSPLICEAPAWTAEGDAVAVSRRSESGNADIWRIALAGGAETNLTQTLPSSESFPSWSPDGSRIAYYHDEDNQLVVANADGSSPVRLFGPIASGDLAWLPDNSSVAVRGTLDGETGILRVPLQGTPTLIAPIAPRAVAANQIRWSPSAERLAYVAHDGLTTAGHTMVFVTRSDGADRQPISRFGQTALNVAWLPTGER